MCKKLFIAAVAILVGTVAVRHSSLAKVWFQDLKQAVQRQVPLDTQIRQLKEEIGEIDKDVKKNLGKLAAQEAESEKLEKTIAALKDSQAGLQAEMTTMIKALDGKTESVSINGRAYRGSALAAKLERKTAEYEARKSELKSMEQLLETKKQGLEAAVGRIIAMREQKAKLAANVGQLESRLQVVRYHATRDNVSIDLDESKVGRCNELYTEIDDQLTLAEKTAQKFEQFGYTQQPQVQPDETNKPTAEVLKAAKKALSPEQAEQRLADNKE
jgi:chromosome segregation ATPase